MDWILLGIPIGIVMLYFGSDWMVRGAKGIALRLGVAPFVIGLTVLAFGSSAPECITSIVSGDTPQIIIGNVVGSNIANIGLAIGLAAVVGPLAAKYKSMRFELAMMMLSAIMVTAMAMTGMIGFLEGLMLFCALFVFVFAVYRLKKDDKEGQEAYTADADEDDGPSFMKSMPMLIVLVVVGLVLLYFGAQFFIGGAKELARMVGVSDMLIGLIVVAIGTSLPELCISVMAAHKGEADLAVSNIVGSNIFNAFFVLGVGSLLTDIPIADSMLMFHLPMMLVFSAVMFLMIRFRNRIDRPMGVILLAMYAVYIVAMAMVPSLTI